MRGWRGGGLIWGGSGENVGGLVWKGGGKTPKIRPFRAFYGEIKKIVGL